MRFARLALLSMVIGLSGCVTVPAQYAYGARYGAYPSYSYGYTDRNWYGNHRYWDWDWGRNRHNDWDRNRHDSGNRNRHKAGDRNQRNAGERNPHKAGERNRQNNGDRNRHRDAVGYRR